MKNRFLTLFFFLVSFTSMKGMESIIPQSEDWQIKLFRQKKAATRERLDSSGRFDKNRITQNPFCFLQFIYHRDYINDSRIRTHIFPFDRLYKKYKDTSIIEICKKTRIDGYSALGVALLRDSKTVVFGDPNFHLEQQRIVQVLLDLGFEPTPADQELAYLELYSRTPELTKTALLLLAGMKRNPESNLSMLPRDMIHEIMSHVGEEPLIPRHLCTNCRKIRKYNT